MIALRKLVTTSLFLTVFILGFVWLVNDHLLSKEEERFKVGATYMTMNNRFYQALHAEIEKRVNEMDGVLYTRNPALDIDKQIEQIHAFIQKKVDVIVLNPVDSSNEDLIGAIKKAKKAGIYTVVVDSQLKDSTAVDSTIVSDNYAAGVLAAEDMMENLQEARIVLLEHNHTQSGTERIQGFVDTIKDQSAYPIIARRESLGQTETAMPQVEELIQENIQFDVIMALNDRAAIGALAALKKHRIERPVLIYGVDGSPDMKSILMTTDDVQGTVMQSPLTMGREAIRVAEQLYKGQSVSKKIVIPVRLLTKENSQYLEKSGWQ